MFLIIYSETETYMIRRTVLSTVEKGTAYLRYGLLPIAAKRFINFPRGNIEKHLPDEYIVRSDNE